MVELNDENNSEYEEAFQHYHKQLGNTHTNMYFIFIFLFFLFFLFLFTKYILKKQEIL